MSFEVSSTSSVKMRLLDKALQWISVLTIICLPVVIILRHLCNAMVMPFWLEYVLLPIATAGAIGYLTNYCAIWMLFKPYKSHGIIPQGVIPANQHRLAASVSKIIPERLLKPETLSQAVTAMLTGLMHDPAFVAKLRSALQKMILEQLQGEKISALLDRFVDKLGGSPERCAALAAGLAEALKRQVPDFLPFIKEKISVGVKEYVRTHVPGMFSGMIMPMVDGFIENLDWNDIGNQICDALMSQRAKEAMSSEIGNLIASVREKIPGALETLVNDEELWNALEEYALPKLQALLTEQLAQNADKIVANLHISEQIEDAINSLPVQEMHRLVLEVSGRELTLLQVLGYFLGCIAGTMLIFCH